MPKMSISQETSKESGRGINARAVIMLAIFLTAGAAAWLTHLKALQFLASPVQTGGGYDFFHYYASVSALEQGIANIYDQELMRRFSAVLSEGRWEVFDNHPLPFYLFFMPLHSLPAGTAFIWHSIAQACMYSAALLILCLQFLRPYGARTAWAAWAVLTAAGMGGGVCLDSLWLGQISGALLLSLSVCLAAAVKRRDALCGAALAAAVLMKLYPALLLLWLLGRRQYKAVLSCLGVLALLGMSAGLQWGFFRFGQYAAYLMHEQSLQSETIANQSLIAALSSVLYDLEPGTLKLISALLAAAASAMLLFCAGRTGRGRALGHKTAGSSITENGNENAGAKHAAVNEDSGEKFTKHTINTAYTKENNMQIIFEGAEFSAWLLMMLIISPLAWGHHYIVIFIPLCVFAAAVMEAEGNSRLQISAAAVLSILTVLFFLDSESFHDGASFKIFLSVFEHKIILLLAMAAETAVICSLPAFAGLKSAAGTSLPGTMPVPDDN